MNDCTCGHPEDEHDVDGCWGEGTGPDHVDGQILDLVCDCWHYEEEWDD